MAKDRVFSEKITKILSSTFDAKGIVNKILVQVTKNPKNYKGLEGLLCPGPLDFDPHAFGFRNRFQFFHPDAGFDYPPVL